MMISENVIILVLGHLLNGLILIFLMTMDLGRIHRNFWMVVTRSSFVLWWLFQMEHILREDSFSLKQLVSEISLGVGLVSLILLINPLKKLLKW